MVEPETPERLLLSFIRCGFGVDVKMRDGFGSVKEVLLLFRHFYVFLFETVMSLSYQIRYIANFSPLTADWPLFDFGDTEFNVFLTTRFLDDVTTAKVDKFGVW